MRSRSIFLWSILPIFLVWGVHVPRNKYRYARIAKPVPSFNFASSPQNSSVSETGRRFLQESEFVTAPGDGHLYLNGHRFDFRAFNTPTLLKTREFEVRDLLETIVGLGTPVTRTYTLQVANTMFEGGNMPPSEAHVIGWDEQTNSWQYNETVWQKMDSVLDLSREYGVKLIIPIINQDYGTSDTDFVGNFNDLIRHRYGIWGYRSTNQAIDWFTDRQMIESYKDLITHLLNRVNTLNGIRYGDDHTVLAFETGNELNWGDAKRVTFQRAPPSKWTLEIAQHIKSLAPNTLVMDGSYSRIGGQGPFWEEDVLDSKYIDLYSYHLYGDKDLDSYDALHKEVRAHGKTLVIGEHGFYSDPSVYVEAYRKFDCAGALIWSLRGHSRKGGFETHSEGNNIFSYHAPGWRNQTSPSFDTQEADVMSATYDASFTTLGLEPAPKPIPGTPQTFFLSNGTHVGLSWRGAAWADHYEIFGAHLQGLFFDVVSNEVQDNVGVGEVFIPLDPNEPTKLLIVHRGKPKRRESHKGWVDRKWCFPGTRCWRNDFFGKADEASDDRLISVSPDHHEFNLKSDSAKSQPAKTEYKLLSPMFPTDLKRALEGGWYSVRGVNSDGVPGRRSRASFLKSNWFDWHSTPLEH